MKKRMMAVVAATATLAVSVVAAAALQDSGDKSVGFQATGPAGLKIVGASKSLKATEAQGQLKITVPMKSLDTGIGLRDKHLRKYLEVSKFPAATLVVPRSSLKLPEDGKESSAQGTGKLTLHGKTNSQSFRYKLKRSGDRYAVQGLGELDIREYGIEVPCYLGVCVDPKVKFKVEFSLRDQ